MIDEFDLDVSDRTWRKIVNIYHDSVRFADAFLGELQNRLGQFDPTFVVHGDHGESFGEHRPYGHFYPSLYEENIHVPTVIAGANTSKKDYEKPFCLLNLPDIVKHLAINGDICTEESEQNKYAFSTDYDGRNERNLVSIRTNNLKYILTHESETGFKEELYDLETDSLEKVDIVNDSDMVEVADSLNKLGKIRSEHENEIIKVRRAIQEHL